jgi:SHS2 domain-containing protein
MLVGQLAGARGYRFLEHTTDAYVEAWGQSLEDTFSSAAEALYDTMLDFSQVQPILEEEINAEGHDELELLYNWLEALLLKLDIDGMVYSRVRIDQISYSENALRLHAIVSGESYDRKKHGSKTEVKGVTYHLMRVEKEGSQVKVRFILDL